MTKRKAYSIDYAELKNKISQIEDVRDRALICLLYGTGGRLNEVLELEKKNFKEEENYLLVSLRTEKNPRHPERIIPINEELEKWIVEPIKVFLETNKEEKLFSIKARRARQIVQKHLQVYPHLLRHTRLTHLATIFDFDLIKIRLFAGWSSFSPAEKYLHLFWKDLRQQFDLFVSSAPQPQKPEKP